METTGSGPAFRKVLLGAQLRRLRERAGITREEAGHLLRNSESKISRMELGRVGFKERDVADLLTLYGVDNPDERAKLLGMMREANEPGWWQQYSDTLPPWFSTYIGLEYAARRIRTYEVQFIPGLLQTEAYARAPRSPPGTPRGRRSSSGSRCAWSASASCTARRSPPCCGR
ncbi:helix-turn-helix domain-containing protein [Allostreptomyces psammosilenae]|uniref:Transcriptional regulator with XRE-family HTH domain n=1 Tax=Allostreptomyces psammosilenae TaxID=1892865 RepID=A0A853A1R3_9ACTN|nr:transcriptional regulator with XRE-family HTH domain [Allostreptomyces psammosilenae]